MKKQVRFAELKTEHRIKEEDGVSRSLGRMDRPLCAMNDPPLLPNTLTGRPAAAKTLIQPPVTVRIPKTMSSAPFLQHAALTPAQKDFLCRMAACQNPERIRHLINNHYMNVLHRCVHAGNDSERDHRAAASLSSLENQKEKHQRKKESQVSSPVKNREKFRSSARPSRTSLSSNASNGRPSRTALIGGAVSLRSRRSPSRVMFRLDEEEEEDEELDEFLSELTLHG